MASNDTALVEALQYEEARLEQDLVDLKARLVTTRAELKGVKALKALYEGRPTQRRRKTAAKRGSRLASVSAPAGEFPCAHCERADFKSWSGRKHHVTVMHPEQAEVA